MEELITRIVAIERQSAADVRQAEDQYAERIDAFRQSLEEEMTRKRERILSEENARFAAAVEEAEKLAAADVAAAQRAGERLFQQPVLVEAIKEDIVAVLLAQEPV